MIITDSDSFRKRYDAGCRLGQLALSVLSLGHYTRGLKIWRSWPNTNGNRHGRPKQILDESIQRHLKLALPMTFQDAQKTGAVDIVIPVYCEKPEALAATLSACQN